MAGNLDQSGAIQVVDGVQRLTTVKHFMSDQLELVNDYLEYLSNLKGLTFTTLDADNSNPQCTRTWFVNTSQEFQDFFRWLIIHSTKAPDELAALSGPAFQNLDFVEGVFDGVKSMSKPYLNLVAEIVHHLGVFSDHGQRIFSAPWIRVPAEFGSLHVSISDENGNTKKNDGARLERTKMFKDAPHVFWWHAKLEPDRDRIHICPDKVASGGRIIVGIFCNHLTT